jgi:hypothetical protein
MAVSESLGGVTVTISGDATKLNADFKSAQSAAQQAGTKVAAAFNASAGSIQAAQNAVKQATANMMQAGAAFGPAAAAGDKVAIASLKQYQIELAQAAAALGRLTLAGETATAEVAKTSEKMRTSFVGAIPGFGVAAERFIGLVPGLGPLLMKAFPVFGAIAFGRILVGLIGDVTHLQEAEEALKKSNEQLDDGYRTLGQSIDKLNIAALARDFGKLSSLKLGALYNDMDAAGDRAKAKALRTEVENLRASWKNPLYFVPILGQDAAKAERDRLKVMADQADLLDAQAKVKDKASFETREEAKRTAASDTGGLASDRISNQMQANRAAAELARSKAEIWIASDHALRMLDVAAIRDSHNRAAAAAAEQVRMAVDTAAKLGAIAFQFNEREIALIRAKAAADSAGKTPLEAAHIQTSAAGQVEGLKAGQQQTELNLLGAVLRAGSAQEDQAVTAKREVMEHWSEVVRKGFEDVDAQWKVALARGAAHMDRWAAQFTRVQEIEARDKGTTDALKEQANKLAFERAYGDESLHNAAQNVDFARQLAAFDSASRDARIAGLSASLLVARAAATDIKGREDVARIQADINRLKAEGANADETAAIRNDQAANRLTTKYKIQAALKNAGQQIPGALGGALASSLTGGGHHGQNVGQQIANSLKGIGKQMMGDVFSSLITTIIANTIGQTILGSVLGLNTAVTGVNSVAINWNTLWLQIKSLFGFAAGGSPPVGVPSVVGERGAELFVPREAGVIIPNHQLTFSPGNMPMPRAGVSTTSSQSSNQSFVFHVNGARDTREVVRSIASYMKTASPKFASASN